MVLDPIPQSLPVHFFGSRPQPPTSRPPCVLVQSPFPKSFCTPSLPKTCPRSVWQVYTKCLSNYGVRYSGSFLHMFSYIYSSLHMCVVYVTGGFRVSTTTRTMKSCRLLSFRSPSVIRFRHLLPPRNTSRSVRVRVRVCVCVCV